MRFFDTLKDPKTYKEIAYLLLSMPLGIAYFVVLVTGFSLGMGLAVIGVGFLILAGLLALGRVGGWLEALLARELLDADVEPSLDLHYHHNQTFLANVGRILTDGKAIRSIVFLGLKFPLGLVTFIFTIVAITIPLALLSAPFTYITDYNIQFGDARVVAPIEVMLTMILGLVLLPISILALKTMATGWRKMAEGILASDTGKSKRKNKMKRDISHLRDDTYQDDDYSYDEDFDDESEEIAAGLRQLLER